MPTWVIEREIPAAGSLTAEQILAISQKSCSVLKNLGPEIQWIESYVTPDKIYCIYIAPDEAPELEYTRQAYLLANSLALLRAVMDPIAA